MKTLIFNGSPRPGGDTAAMVSELRRHLAGEVIELKCYREKISPCVDCRRCMREPGCAIPDGMQKYYAILQDCDCVVIASSVYYSLPTAPLLAVMSRLQTWFCASRFRRDPVQIRPKRGGIILAGGGSGSAEPAEATARRLLKYMKAKQIGPVAASLATDRIPAREDTAALEAARSLAAFLNGFQE